MLMHHIFRVYMRQSVMLEASRGYVCPVFLPVLSSLKTPSNIHWECIVAPEAQAGQRYIQW